MALLVFLLSCKKGNKECDCVWPFQLYYLKAEVIQTSDLSCRRPVLSFSEDSLRIRSITGLKDLFYVCDELPASVNIVAEKLYVKVRKLKAGEFFACLDIGISYPGIKVLDARKR
ncbi:MAG: hypothetical protein B6D37_02485 [Sphingobacteriales bacterium UTBCD1]|nr:MAG: hypothetical protein B6D37_02485 [Sphingobacteriales bacterium UTBCD1]